MCHAIGRAFARTADGLGRNFCACRRFHDTDMRGDEFVTTTSSSAVRKWVPWVFAAVVWIELWLSGGYWRYVVIASLVAAAVILLAIKRLSGRQGNREKHLNR